MRKNMVFQQMVLRGVLVAFCMVALTGCASLRKKFTRVKKNKDQKEDFIPVLQPVEYKKVEETPVQVYAQHYSMIKIYFKDLWDTLGKPDSNAKRERYIFTEILAHFDTMAALLTDVKYQEAQSLRARFMPLLTAYDKADGVRRYDLIAGDLRAIERDFYKILKPVVVAGALKPAVK